MEASKSKIQTLKDHHEQIYQNIKPGMVKKAPPTD